MTRFFFNNLQLCISTFLCHLKQKFYSNFSQLAPKCLKWIVCAKEYPIQDHTLHLVAISLKSLII